MIKCVIVIIAFLSISGCGCKGIECAPCIGEPRIDFISNSILAFDTTSNNFTLSDLDTFLLYKNESDVKLKIPNDTFFNDDNLNKIYGGMLKYNTFISDKRQNRFFKIDNLDVRIIDKGTGCCACDKYEVNTININDTAYRNNQLPLLVKK